MAGVWRETGGRGERECVGEGKNRARRRGERVKGEGESVGKCKGRPGDEVQALSMGKRGGREGAKGKQGREKLSETQARGSCRVSGGGREASKSHHFASEGRGDGVSRGRGEEVGSTSASLVRKHAEVFSIQEAYSSTETPAVFKSAS